MLKLHRKQLIALLLHATFLLGGIPMQGTHQLATSNQTIGKQDERLNKMNDYIHGYICQNSSVLIDVTKNLFMDVCRDQGVTSLDQIEDEFDDNEWQNCFLIEPMKKQCSTGQVKNKKLHELLKAAYHAVVLNNSNINEMDDYIRHHVSTYGLKLKNKEEKNLFVYHYTFHEFDMDEVEKELNEPCEESVLVSNMQALFELMKGIKLIQEDQEIYTLLKKAYESAKGSCAASVNEKNRLTNKVKSQPKDMHKSSLQYVDRFMKKNAYEFKLYKLASQQNKGRGPLQCLFTEEKLKKDWMDVVTKRYQQKDCYYLNDLLKKCDEYPTDYNKRNMFELLEKAVLHAKTPEEAHGINDFLEHELSTQSRQTIERYRSISNAFLRLCVGYNITTKQDLINQIGENAPMENCVFVKSAKYYWRTTPEYIKYQSSNNDFSLKKILSLILPNASKIYLRNVSVRHSENATYLGIKSNTYVMRSTNGYPNVTLVLHPNNYFIEFFPDKMSFFIHDDWQKSSYLVDLLEKGYKRVQLLAEEETAYTILGGSKGRYLLLLPDNGNKIVIYENKELAKLSVNQCKEAYFPKRKQVKEFTGEFLRPRVIFPASSHMIYFIGEEKIYAFNQQESTDTETSLNSRKKFLSIFKIVNFNNKSYIAAAGKEEEEDKKFVAQIFDHRYWYLFAPIDKEGSLEEKKMQVETTEYKCNKLFIENNQKGISLFLATYMRTKKEMEQVPQPERSFFYVILRKYSMKIKKNHKTESKYIDQKKFDTQRAKTIKKITPDDEYDPYDEYQYLHSVKKVFSLGNDMFFISCTAAAFYMAHWPSQNILRIKNSASIAAEPIPSRDPIAAKMVRRRGCHSTAVAQTIGNHSALDGNGLICLFSISPNSTLPKYLVCKPKGLFESL